MCLACLIWYKNSTTFFFTSLLPLLDAKLSFYSIENVQMKWISLYSVYFCASACVAMAYMCCISVFLVPHFQLLYRFSPLYYPSHAQSYANLFSALSDSFPIQIITCVRNIDSFFPFFSLSFSTHICGYVLCAFMAVDWKRDKPKYELVGAESIERWEISRFFCHTNAHLCREQPVYYGICAMREKPWIVMENVYENKTFYHKPKDWIQRTTTHYPMFSLKDTDEMLTKSFVARSKIQEGGGKREKGRIARVHGGKRKRSRENSCTEKRYQKMFAFECKHEKKKIVQRIVHSFYLHLRLVFVVNICNFIQRTSVPLNIIPFGVCCLALCFVHTQIAYSFTRSYCNANTDLSAQKRFRKHAEPHTNTHTALFPLISIHYSGFNCGDESEKKLAKSFYSHIFEYGMDVAYD